MTTSSNRAYCAPARNQIVEYPALVAICHAFADVL
jgi:hypothetical protein